MGYRLKARVACEASPLSAVMTSTEASLFRFLHKLTLSLSILTLVGAFEFFKSLLVFAFPALVQRQLLFASEKGTRR